MGLELLKRWWRLRRGNIIAKKQDLPIKTDSFFLTELNHALGI